MRKSFSISLQSCLVRLSFTIWNGIHSEFTSFAVNLCRRFPCCQEVKTLCFQTYYLFNTSFELSISSYSFNHRGRTSISHRGIVPIHLCQKHLDFRGNLFNELSLDIILIVVLDEDSSSELRLGNWKMNIYIYLYIYVYMYIRKTISQTSRSTVWWLLKLHISISSLMALPKFAIMLSLFRFELSVFASSERIIWKRCGIAMRIWIAS